VSVIVFVVCAGLFEVFLTNSPQSSEVTQNSLKWLMLSPFIIRPQFSAVPLRSLLKHSARLQEIVSWFITLLK
jgi:hypothetical protein